MIDKLIAILGYTGADPVVIYLCVMTCCILVIALGYRFFDFILTLISSLCGRGRDIKF